MFGGLFGAALDGLASEVACVLVSLLYMKRLLGISIWQQIASHGSTIASLAVMSVAVLLGQRFINPVTANELVRLIVLSSLGGVAYVVTGLAIWQAGGRSGGPVSEIINIAMRFMPSGRKQADAGA